jgi:hypothetical protein
MILAESRVRVADRADHAARQVGAPIHEIEHGAGVGVQHQPVDGEIAAQHVLARIGFKADELRMPAVLVIVIAAEGGHLHLVEDVAHQHHSEVRPNPAGAREQIHDAVGTGVCRNVEILGLHSQ